MCLALDIHRAVHPLVPAGVTDEHVVRRPVGDPVAVALPTPKRMWDMHAACGA